MALASMVYTFFDTKSKSRISVNEQLAQELHKSVTKKFKRKKVYAKFKDIIWAADLVKWNHCLLRIKMLKSIMCHRYFN